jgi:hypothetical protein
MVLAALLPARRPRYSSRTIKCSTSRYHERDVARPQTPAAITAIDITLRTPPLSTATPRRAHRKTPASLTPRPPTRRQRVTALIATGPHRDWPGRELAERLQVKPRIMHTQLREWALPGFITRTGYGTYRLNTPPATTSSTSAAGP